MKPTDEFAIASNTKTFTAALVLALVRDGKVLLDSPISAYGIDVPGADVITVRELLSHTSGIPPLGGDFGPDQYSLDWQNKILADLGHHYSVAEIVAYVRARPLLFPPGTATSYSNINTLLAAQIVENVTGQSWTAVLHERLLGPLGLASTYDAANETPPTPAVPGLFVLEGNPTVLNNADFDHTAVVSGLGPAGGMVSDAADMVSWGNALLRDGSVLGPELSAAAHEIGPGGTGLGVLGFMASAPCAFSTCPAGTTFRGYGGTGSLPGARSLLVYDTDTDSVVMIFANRSPADLEAILKPELDVIAKAETPTS